jgi:hypothetical protein
MFKRKSPDLTKAAEAELGHLRDRRDTLAGRLRDAEAAAEIAVRTQREALVAEALDGPVVKRVEADAQAALFRRDAFADALAETARMLAEAEQKLAAERDKAERERVAADLEQRAAEIDMSVARFPAAVAAVATLHADFIALVQAKGLRFEVFAGLERTASHIAFNALHAALSALPVQVSPRHPEAPAPRDVREDVREQLTQPMRLLAKAIRSGNAALTDNQSLAVPEALPAVVIAERDTVLKTPILYVSADRRPVQVVAGAVRLPGPIALAAIEQGVGFEPGSPEAQDIIRTMSRDGANYGFRGDFLDIGVDLSEYVAQERQRLAERAAA